MPTVTPPPSAYFLLPTSMRSSLAGRPGNARCLDCAETSGIDWASVRFGATLCVRCAGRHRALHVNVARIKSLALDSWSADELALMSTGSNKRCRAWIKRSAPRCAECCSSHNDDDDDDTAPLQKKQAPPSLKRYECTCADAYRATLSVEALGHDGTAEPPRAVSPDSSPPLAWRSLSEPLPLVFTHTAHGGTRIEGGTTAAALLRLKKTSSQLNAKPQQLLRRGVSDNGPRPAPALTQIHTQIHLNAPRASTTLPRHCFSYATQIDVCQVQRPQ